MLPVGPASRRSSPQGKRPTSQAEPCRRDHNGSRCRTACPTSARGAAEGARGVVRSLDLFPRWGSSLEFGWSQGHRETPCLRAQCPQFHHQPGSSVSMSRAAASIERVTLGGTERNVLSNSLSSSGEPTGAISTRWQKFPQVHFSHPPWADGPEFAPSCLASY